ncbi:MAG: hypothetical protein V4712_15035 [Pseudomonadota bacterium]
MTQALSIIDVAYVLPLTPGATVPWRYMAATHHMAQFEDADGVVLGELVHGSGFSIAPVGDTLENTGVFTLIAAAPVGAVAVRLLRATPAEQFYDATPGAEGVERQLDRVALTLQELAAGVAGSLRTRAPVPPIVPEEGRSVMWQDGRWVPAFDAAEIIAAGQHAIDAQEAALAAALYGNPQVDFVANLLADTSLTYAPGLAGSVEEGDIVTARGDDLPFKVAAAGAVDHTLISAGGVKYYAQARQGTLWLEQCGGGPLRTAAENDAAFVKAIGWLNGGTYRTLKMGTGGFNLSTKPPAILGGDKAFQGAGFGDSFGSRLIMADTVVDGNVIRVGNGGVTTTARVEVGGLSIEFLRPTGVAGYALCSDGAPDVTWDTIRFIKAAGIIDLGPTAASARNEFRRLRGGFRDVFDHPVVRGQRFTNWNFKDVVLYGDGSIAGPRTATTIQIPVKGICDTLDWVDVTIWSQVGSPYGVDVLADEGTFVNANMYNIILDKTGGQSGAGAAWRFRQTAACTAVDADSNWKIQNIDIEGARSDTGGVNTGGRVVEIEQGANSTWAFMRGFRFHGMDWTVRNRSALKTVKTGTSILDGISVQGGRVKDAVPGVDTVDCVFEMGCDNFIISDVVSAFAERKQTPSITAFVKVTNPACTRFVVSDNLVHNVTTKLIDHPTYTALSAERVESGNSFHGPTDLALPYLIPYPVQPAVSGVVANAALNAAAVTAGAAEAASTGRRLVLPRGTLPFIGQFVPPTTGGFVLESKATLLVQSNQPAGVFRSAAPDTALENVILDGLRIVFDTDPGTGNPFTGNGIVGKFSNSQLHAPKVENYWNDQAFLIAGYNTQIYDPFFFTNDPRAGTGGIRCFGGYKLLIANACGQSGDDAIQIVQAESGIMVNLAATDIIYKGGNVKSLSARAVIIFLNTVHTVATTGCGFVDIVGATGPQTALASTASSVRVSCASTDANSGIIDCFLKNVVIDEAARRGTSTAGAGGLQVSGAVQGGDFDVAILAPDRRVLEVNTLSGIHPTANRIKVRSNKAPAITGLAACVVSAGVNNTLVPEVVAPADLHAVHLTGGDRTKVSEGKIRGIQATRVGVRVNVAGATNTTITQTEVVGAGTSISFDATAGTSNHISLCDLGGMAIVNGGTSVQTANRA